MQKMQQIAEECMKETGASDGTLVPILPFQTFRLSG